MHRRRSFIQSNTRLMAPVLTFAPVDASHTSSAAVGVHLTLDGFLLSSQLYKSLVNHSKLAMLHTQCLISRLLKQWSRSN
jgi:hypothetical protein